jgi:hypothetical protein
MALAPGRTFAVLAAEVGLSVGEAHNAVQRLLGARLLSARGRRVVRPALYEFVVSGVPYAFPAILGGETRGVPTASSAPPLSRRMAPGGTVVWPSADGSARGQSLTPLYPGAVTLPRRNRALYHLLALVDAVRVGRARERRLAKELLRAALEEAEA